MFWTGSGEDGGEPVGESLGGLCTEWVEVVDEDVAGGEERKRFFSYCAAYSEEADLVTVGSVFVLAWVEMRDAGEYES